MENDKKTFICQKCGSEVVISEHQNLGSCSSCNSLVPLPYFITNVDEKINSETYHNMLNRVNKANEYNLESQFHRAFNLYDKLIKNYYNLGIEDYYPYFGKLLSQYGVVYTLNDKLEYELVCLNVLDQSVMDNENYHKMMTLADANTKEILVQITSKIDHFQKNVQKNIVSSEPMDICLLVDGSNYNPNKEEDLEIAAKLKDKYQNVNIKIHLTSELFLNGVSENFAKELYRIINLSNQLVVISTNGDHLNSNLFRHIWMNYFSQPEIKNTITDRMVIVCNEQEGIQELPISDLRFYTEREIDKLFDELNISYEKLQSEEQKFFDNLPKDSTCLELLKNKEFEKVRQILNQKMENRPLTYVEWWYMYLAKHNISTENELEEKVINPIESYYFVKTYLYAPRTVKNKLYEYYTNALNKNLNIDEVYENEIKKIQKSYFKKEITKLVLIAFLVLFVTLVCYWTLTFSSLSSTIIIFALNGIGYYFLVKKIFNLFNVGKVPGTIRTDIEKSHYYQQIRKALEPAQAALFLPNYFKKKIQQATFIVLVICALSTLSFVIKDMIVKFQNNNLSYYYVFDEVIITGGYSEDIVIPSTIDGREVTTISARAFYNNNELKSITISEGITEIGSSAFGNCPNLEYAKVPSTIYKLRTAPFEGCNELKYFIYNGKNFNRTSFLGNNYQKEMLDVTFEEPLEE